MRRRQRVLTVALQFGVLDQMRRFWGPESLTTLAYHRVVDWTEHDFAAYLPNVSAHPADFAAQMDYMQAHFHLVGLSDVVAYVREEKPLPPYPALITFDDGYRDNYLNAWPVLRERGIPAAVFLATDFVGGTRPFFWDLIAYCFKKSDRRQATLPYLGAQSWSDEAQRNLLVERLVDVLKQCREGEREEALRALPELLDVPVYDGAFAELFLTWPDVAEMSAAGVEFGAHTQSHPILTCISPEQAREQISGSRRYLVETLGRPVTAFAYPGGLPGQFDGLVQEMVMADGFDVAFTLVPGPLPQGELANGRFTLRRTLIDYRDTLPRFVAKVVGLPRLIGLPR